MVPGLFAALLLFAFLNRTADEYGAIVWVLAVAAPLIAYWVCQRAKRKRENTALQQVREAPCIHGTVGARIARSKCKACVDETLASEAALQEKWAEWTTKARTPQYLSQMDPVGFERLVCDLFVAQGYDAKLTPMTGDEGVDAYLRKNGRLCLLQCKRVKGRVGQPVLRDLFGTMMAANADEGLVVTTGVVSKQARSWIRALSKPIRIIELDELTDLVRRYFANDSAIPASFVTNKYEAPAQLQVCPECGKTLRVVKGPYGKFLGCTGYPNCRLKRKQVPRIR